MICSVGLNAFVFGGLSRVKIEQKQRSKTFERNATAKGSPIIIIAIPFALPFCRFHWRFPGGQSRSRGEGAKEKGLETAYFCYRASYVLL